MEVKVERESEEEILAKALTNRCVARVHFTAVGDLSPEVSHF